MNYFFLPEARKKILNAAESKTGLLEKQIIIVRGLRRSIVLPLLVA
jgi:hypothetical protein